MPSSGKEPLGWNPWLALVCPQAWFQLSWRDGQEPALWHGGLPAVWWRCWATSSGWMRRNPHALSSRLTWPESFALSPSPPHPWAAPLPGQRSPGEQARAVQEVSLQSGRTELVRTAQLGCCWPQVTPGDAQASSQDIQEGIPTPLPWPPPICSTRVLKAEVISRSKYGPSDLLQNQR